MDVLLSIKPKYVKSILNGTKKFEFRKKNFKRTDIDKIFIYSSSPKKRIVGYFKIDKIIEESPKELWAYCWTNAGISREDFFKYFKGKDIGIAIKIIDLKIFSSEINPYQLIESFHPPQSFCYIANSESKVIIKAGKEITQENYWYWQQTFHDIWKIIDENEPSYETMQLLLQYLKVDGWIEDFNKERKFKGDN